MCSLDYIGDFSCRYMDRDGKSQIRRMVFPFDLSMGIGYAISFLLLVPGISQGNPFTAFQLDISLFISRTIVSYERCRTAPENEGSYIKSPAPPSVTSLPTYIPIESHSSINPSAGV